MIGAFLKGIPLWVWIALGVLAGGVYYGHTRYEAGQAEVRTEWNAAIEKGKKELQRIKGQQAVVTTKIEYRTVEKLRVIHEKGDTIVKLVDRFIPTDSPHLPGSFRVLYDAAVTNTVPDPANIPDAVPVALADVARTDAINFERCHVAYAVVAGWQSWAAEQAAVR